MLIFSLRKLFITVILFISWEIHAQVALPTFQGVQIKHCDNTLTVNQSDRGWYSSNGSHTASNANTYTGKNSYYSWFTFDLSGFSGGACTVTLRLELESYSTNASTTTSTIYDVSTSHDDLVASSSGSSGQTIYADLGAGNSYGSATFSNGNEGDIIEYELSSQAISDVNSAAGGWFSVGTTMDDGSSGGYIRFSGGEESRTHQLVIKY
jgi:hypothetical protein